MMTNTTQARTDLEILRELLISEHEMQRVMVAANLAESNTGYRPRFRLLLGSSGSIRRRVVRGGLWRAKRFTRRGIRWSRARVIYLWKPWRRAWRWTRARVIHLRKRLRGEHTPVIQPYRFSDSDRRKRQRMMNEYQSVAFSGIAELQGRHRGERCFIIGNGPSLADVDLAALTDETTFVTNWFANHPFADALAPNYYCICSHELFGGWRNEIPEFNSDLRQRIEDLAHSTTMVLPYRFMPYVETGGLFTTHDRRYLLFDRPKIGIDQAHDVELDLSRPLHDGYTVIITFCLTLAKWMGFSEIYLLGVDSNYGISSPNDPKQYFYDTSLHTSSTSKFESLDRIWAPGGPVFQNYEIVRRRFDADGVRVVNLTPGGRLDVFERSDLVTILNGGS